MLSRLVPRVRIDPKLDLAHLTHDSVMLKAYLADPLYQTKITPRIAAELFATIRDTRARAAQFRIPLFILHGTADPITSPTGSYKFYQMVGCPDKTYKRYEGDYHNLFVETNR